MVFMMRDKRKAYSISEGMEKAESSFDIVNVLQGVSAGVYDVEDSEALLAEAKGQGIPVNRYKLLYVCKSGGDIAGGVFAFAGGGVFEAYPVVMSEFRGAGLAEILCGTIINEYYDLYDVDKTRLQIVISSPLLISTLERKGMVEYRRFGKWIVMVMEKNREDDF